MNNKKLVPYVELISRPRRGIIRAESSPEPSPDHIRTSVELVPRKRKRSQEDDPQEDSLLTVVLWILNLFCCRLKPQNKGRSASWISSLIEDDCM